MRFPLSRHGVFQTLRLCPPSRRFRRGIRLSAAISPHARRCCGGPGLTLTLAQAGRLFGISSDACARIFGQLSEEGLLQPSRHGGYARRFEHP